ncbi:MAG: 3-isopropylmalate dehydrogenase [Leptospirillia bacterium]
MTHGKTHKILLLPGDGIGPEVMKPVFALLSEMISRKTVDLQVSEALIGGAAFDQTGHPLPADTVSRALDSDAVLLAAVGGPKYDTLPYEHRPERALLGIREKLGAFANLRPAKLFPQLANASTLKPEVIRGLDLVVVRELTGGIYFGSPRGIVTEDGVRVGINTERYSEPEIERIARVAFNVARSRKKKVTSVDKANVLESSVLWREVVVRVAREFPDVTLEHMYVDNAAMQLVRNPGGFDVIVTGNIFGDILSDEASQLTGSIGMLASASVGGKTGLYEPIHGSAPDIAGKDLANPSAMFLSLAMLLDHSLGEPALARQLEKAVESVLEEGVRTRDIAEPGCTLVGCREMGERISRAFFRLLESSGRGK